MPYAPDKNHRRSIRLGGYDYSQPGAYFVTVCTRDRECLFGHVVNGEVRLNDAGEIVRSVWDGLPDQFSGMELDAFVIMPNHVHGIAAFVGAGLGGCLRSPETDRAASRSDGPEFNGVVLARCMVTPPVEPYLIHPAKVMGCA
jgi:putative transposase